MLYKILLLGDGAVGKTSTILKYVENRIPESYSATMGVDIMNTEVKTTGNLIVSLNIWDIAGQSHFKSIRSKFYSGAEAAIVIFDVTRPETFNHIKEWISEVNIELKEKIPMILVGNKVDLQDEKRVSLTDMVFEKEKHSNIFAAFETSAVTGEGINIVFQKIAEKLLFKYR
ncbi:MAG: GTPase KRas precursor [Candidatus Heimdallarchaeota archaeon LC_3]|nr:MAG: GTPase KRas precursor [Candidatus Heimdallarchaeota archaeon LC_3]